MVGSLIVETGSFSSPQSVSTNISTPTNERSRIFVKGSTGPVVSPTISNGNNTQELFIYGVDNTNYVELTSLSNLQLNGTLVLKNGSYVSLHWVESVSSWIEVTRNET